MKNIQVVYALSNEQIIYNLQVEDCTTIKNSIIESGILNKYPELKIEELNVGIFSEKKDFDYIVENNDRVEIYRELTIDPKQARAIKVKEDRKKKSAKDFRA